MSTDTNTSGRAWARAGFVFGAAGSLAGNVLDAWLPYGDTPGKIPGHAPIAQQAGSIVWPSTLIVAVEVMSRVDWPASKPWKLARFGGLGTLAVGCAIISFGHIHKVLTEWHYGTFGSFAGAVVLDALMVLCGFGQLAASKPPVSSSSSARPGDDTRQDTSAGAVPPTGTGATGPGGLVTSPPPGPGPDSGEAGSPAGLPGPTAVSSGTPAGRAPEDTEDTCREDTRGQSRVYLTAVPEDTRGTVLAGRRTRAAGTPSRTRVAASIGVPEDSELVAQLRVLRRDTEDALATVRPVGKALGIGKDRARRVLDLDAITPHAEGEQ